MRLQVVFLRLKRFLDNLITEIVLDKTLLPPMLLEYFIFYYYCDFKSQTIVKALRSMQQDKVPLHLSDLVKAQTREVLKPLMLL